MVTEKGVFPGGSAVKNLPAMLAIWVQSLGQDDPLEKEMAAHSNVLAWEIPRTEEPRRFTNPQGHKESDTTERLTLSFHFCLGDFLCALSGFGGGK